MLIFSKTTGYRHASIPAGVEALRELSRELGVEAEASEDSACFEPQRLAGFRAVIWLSTSGNVLSAEQRDAFQAFVCAGGGYLGIHAASASEDDWPWYAELVGARFTRHPEPQPARLMVEDREHPATAHLRPQWTRTDEWYSFRTNPRATAHVLASLDLYAPPTLLGWSFGGLVAQHIALAHPATVRALVLVSTSPRFVASADWPHAMTETTLTRFGDELRASYKLTLQRFLTLQVQGSEGGRATLASLRNALFARHAPSQSS